MWFLSTKSKQSMNFPCQAYAFFIVSQKIIKNFHLTRKILAEQWKLCRFISSSIMQSQHGRKLLVSLQNNSISIPIQFSLSLTLNISTFISSAVDWLRIWQEEMNRFPVALVSVAYCDASKSSHHNQLNVGWIKNTITWLIFRGQFQQFVAFLPPLCQNLHGRINCCKDGRGISRYHFDALFSSKSD